MENSINVGFNRVDMINVVSCAQDIKLTKDQTLEIVGVHVYWATDHETGELKKVGAIKISDGTIFGFTSSTLIECAERIADVLSEDDVNAVCVKTICRTSNQKRDFYQFTVVDIIENK